MDQINNILTTVADVIPIPPGDDAFIQVREASKIYAASLWYTKIFQKATASVEAERLRRGKDEIQSVGYIQSKPY